MIADINLLDPDKKYSYADYLKWTFDESVELIKGKLFRMPPAPSSRHQDISRELLIEIGVFLKGKSCKVYNAPFDVRLFPIKEDGKNFTVVQPDLCVICDLTKIDEKGCFGPPDLIIEIQSPSTTKKDMQDKFYLYKEAGVKEYWIVVPSADVVEVFDLTDGEYRIRKHYTIEDSIPVGVLPGLEIELMSVFEGA